LLGELKMTVFDDFKRLQESELPQILVLYGESADILALLKKQLFEAVHYDPANFEHSYFDLTTQNAQLALEELESLPFLSDKHLVILENLTNLTTTKKNVFDENQMKTFLNFLSNPNPTTQLIVILHENLDGRLKATKTLKKVATLLEAVDLKPFELEKYFAQKSQLPKPILNLIFEKSNFTFSIIEQNLELLKTFVGQRAITIEDVEKVVPKSLQDNIFEVTNLIFKGKVEAARDLAGDLTLQGEDLIKILAVLTHSFRLHLQVKLMQNLSWAEAKQTTTLKIHPYRVKLANQTVQKLSQSYLEAALRTLIDLDYKIKSGFGDKTFLFDLVLVKLSLKEL
jgi:DNA polymerase-3 subunit delta